MRALLVAGLLAALPARAQAPLVRTLVEHLSRGLPTTRVGEWVTYRLQGGDRVHYWRLAVVGAEQDRLGRDALWLELDVGTHPAMAAPLAQLKLLVARGAGAAPSVTRLIVATGFDRPQEYSAEALAAVQGRAPTRRPSRPPPVPPAVASGREAQVMTAAGTLPAVPLEVRYRDTVVQRLWLSRAVPLLRLVKLEIPGIAQVMTVQGFGADARPRMALPPPEAPKVRLEYVDEAFASLPQLPEEGP